MRYGEKQAAVFKGVSERRVRADWTGRDCREARLVDHVVCLVTRTRPEI
jgi:hypothetical protein